MVLYMMQNLHITYVERNPSFAKHCRYPINSLQQSGGKNYNFCIDEVGGLESSQQAGRLVGRSCSLQIWSSILLRQKRRLEVIYVNTDKSFDLSLAGKNIPQADGR